MKGVSKKCMFVLLKNKQHKEETPVSLNTINSRSNHAKSVIQKIQSSGELPFTDVLSKDAIDQKLKDLEYRDRIFSPDVTIFAFLAQVTGADRSCQAGLSQVIAHFAAAGKEVPSANTAAYCKARGRLPEEVLSGLTKESAKMLEEQVNPNWLWRGRHIKMPDGTSVSMPDTKANQKRYPQPDSQAKGAGFPLARMVGVFSLSTGCLLDFAMKAWSGKGTGETSLLRELYPIFKENDVVMGDALYTSFFYLPH